MTTNATKRTCRTCPTPLNRYNRGDQCGACDEREREAYLRDPSSHEWSGTGVKLIPVTHVGTKTWQILEAMPGTCAEISERTGLDLRNVRTRVRDLCVDGRAYKHQFKRKGRYGEKSVYHRSKDGTYFDTGRRMSLEQQIIGLLERGVSTPAQMAREAQTSPRSIQRVLRRMESQGRVENTPIKRIGRTGPVRQWSLVQSEERAAA